MKLKLFSLVLGLTLAITVVAVVLPRSDSPAPTGVAHQQFLDPPWSAPTTAAPTTVAPVVTTTSSTSTMAPPVPTSQAAPARPAVVPARAPAPTVPIPKTPVVKAQAAISSAPASASAKWACIIKRESGGNPAAINPSSHAGGLFQFLPSSWRAYGGTGNAWQASVAEQWRVALHAYAVSGWSPWAGGNYSC